MSWNCPRNQSSNQRNVNVREAQEVSKEEIERNNPSEEGEPLMLKKVLLKKGKKYMNHLKGNVCSKQGVSHKVSFVKWLLIVVVLYFYHLS